MKANVENLLDLLRTTVRLEIPIFQRSYSWTEDQCKQLWEDIRRIGKADPEERPYHFLGTVVMVEDGEGEHKRYQVIDGQQRLTSVTLLLCALAEVIGTPEPEPESRAASDMPSDANSEMLSKAHIRDCYIVNGDESGGGYRRLHLAQDDDRDLQSVIGSKSSPGPAPEPADSENRAVWRNFCFFRNRLQHRPDRQFIWQGLTKLRVIAVRLQRKADNPQLIFESMNSTGLDLAEADLIRNYVLMGLDSQEQASRYNRYWKPLEDKFPKRQGRGKLDSFIRHYLTLKQGEIPRKDQVYYEFKKFAMKQNDPHSMLDEIFKYAEYYCKIEFHDESDVDLQRVFRDLTKLKVDVAYPFMLKLYDDYSSRRALSKDDFIAIVRLIESYVFRRIVCQNASGSMNNTFAWFSHNIDDNAHLDSVKAHFLQMRSYRAFPTDGEFRQCIATHNMYHIRSRMYCLHRFENHGHEARVDIDGLSIEHIMPQTLTPEWQRALGEYPESEHEKDVHRIGNLTLVRIENNARLSNNAFRVKCNTEGGLGDSTIKIGRGICEHEEWNGEAIERRSLMMAEEAVEIWPYPSLPPELVDRYMRSETEVAKLAVENHLFMQNDELKALFEPLRNELLSRNELDEVILKAQVKYQAETVVLRVFHRIQAKGAVLLLNLPVNVSVIDDPRKLCLGGTFSNGEHYTAIWYRDTADVGDIVKIVNQVLARQGEGTDEE